MIHYKKCSVEGCNGKANLSGKCPPHQGITPNGKRWQDAPYPRPRKAAK